MRDSCPHRGIPLSVGWFDGERVTCRYHGWEFEPCSGQCALIPSLTSHDHLDATRIYATAFACEERDGHAWVYIPGAGVGAQDGRERNCSRCRSWPSLGRDIGRRISRRTCRCNVDHGIIGLMDPAHGPFVHQAWWWRSRSSIREKTKKFEPIPEGFRMSAHAPSGNSAPYKLLGVYGQPVETTIDFVLPNRRTETDSLRRQVVLQPDDGDAGDRLDVPHRRDGGVECFLSRAVGDCRLRSSLARSLCARTR